MHSHDEPGASAASPNPIHVVGPKDLTAARTEALHAFHQGLDAADRNLQALQPAKRAVGPADPAGTPPFAFRMQAPWYAAPADPPA